MSFGVTELLVLLAIVLLLFGTKRLRTLGGDLGTAIKGFRKAMHNDDESAEASTQPSVKSETESPK